MGLSFAGVLISWREMRELRRRKLDLSVEEEDDLSLLPLTLRNLSSMPTRSRVADNDQEAGDDDTLKDECQRVPTIY